MKKNLRIRRDEASISVQPDGGEWMLAIGEQGVCLLKPIQGIDDHGDPIDGWIEAELADAMDRGDDRMIEAFLAAHYPEIAALPPVDHGAAT